MEAAETLQEFFATGLGFAVVVVISLWSVVWKGVALYRAGVLRDKGWFVALFLINTVGILEILYLAIFQHRKTRRV
jgi:hypothetical protein